MSSQNLCLVERCSVDNSSESLSNKETQTSSIYITDSFDLFKGPSRPLPKGIDKSKVQASLNVLDCKVIKDPSDSKPTADIVTQSYIKNIENSTVSISDDGGTSRLNYCKEIEPYLNAHLNNCADNVDSLEQLIQDALEEFPDYQPCFEVYEGTKDIQEKISRTSAMNMESSKTTHLDESSAKGNSNTDRCNKKSEELSAPVSLKPICSDNIESLVESDEKIKENDKINRIISKESISKCVKDSLAALKCSASSYFDKMEVVIGIKKSENTEDKPTHYPIEQPKIPGTSQNVQTEPANSLNSIINLLEKHNEKITALKETVIDIAEKFYRTSKDAVTLINSESAKLLSKGKTDIFNADTIQQDKQSKVKEMNLRNISVKSITNMLFQKAENKPIENEPSNGEVLSPPTKISEKSPLTIASQLIKITDEIVESKIDKSSPYDNVMPLEVSNKIPVPPETKIPTVSVIDRTPEAPSASNMFTVIKSKIFSIFRDESEKIAEPEVIDAQNDEEDPFERFMEQ